MGLCCSVSNSNENVDFYAKGDESALIDSNQNAITEAMLKANIVAPPAPLLKEINFAAIADENDDITDSSLDDEDIQELLNEEEEDGK
ncbi:hypothetical protein TRFO_19866 [Tritrichomonas foetus]|uniref:Uncharacterized protein n=1 Tax=Tritrichomonas foetus TaxID=1144522 RepID=A0A1J4KHQ6_9EUKA|nr:hypothetical protein TRFO_19866 [Tritrichomonas foetus]|eukprot:OHT10739.1 hypothetical protein TRFO_19866 [Tritrichomonas foetus]